VADRDAPRPIPTAFLDRDGTINRKARGGSGSYITSWEDFRFLPGAIEAMELLRHAGWRIVVVTNQRGVALGTMTREQVDEIHRRMALLAPIDAVYVCPHDEGECDCRKPEVGLFRAAQRDDPGIDFATSVVFGDAESDIEAGQRLGCRTVQVGAPPLPSLLRAVRELLAEPSAA